MKILSFDPSGNFIEGKGTTGWAYAEDNEEVTMIGEIKSIEFSTTEEYWNKHTSLIKDFKPNYVVIEGYRLYNHRGKEASIQANSTLETPQLIGVLRHYCWLCGIPATIQYASQVKSRWSDKVLQAKGILDKRNRFKGEQTNKHKRDALRHLLHFERYGAK